MIPKPFPPFKYLFKPGFASGVCMSWYPIFKQKGAVYRDSEGRERDLLEIMAHDYGIDTLCLQVFMGDASNDPWRGGGIDAHYCLKIAQEAKKYNMRIMLSLILGSGWNNAGIQTKPVEWYCLPLEQLKQKLYDYVYETTRIFIDGGAAPEWVKIGNEANLGILLPDGSTDDYEKLSQLYSTGHDAVKAADPAIKTMVHLANCEVTEYMLEYYKKLEEHHCRYDMVALSFYPYSVNKEQLPRIAMGNMFEALRATLVGLCDEIGKPIMIVECGFDNDDVEKGYGQFMNMLRIISECPELSHGGIIYWEPEMIHHLYYGPYPYNAWQEDGRPSHMMDAYHMIGQRKD